MSHGAHSPAGESSSQVSSMTGLPIIKAEYQQSDEEITTYPEGGLEAWSVVFGSFCGMVASFGLLNSIGTYQVYLSTHQLAHLSPSSVGWIFSFYTFLSFFCGVQIGPVFDVKGPRYLVLAGSVCLVCGMFGAAQSTELWHFLLSFSLLGGIGTSLIFTPAIASVAHYFSRSRATATGIASTGGSFGGIIFPLTLQKLFPQVGFAWATRIIALLFLTLLIFANLLIRSRLPPKPASSVWPDFRIFKDPIFALTTAGVFFIEWGIFVPISYISSYALATGVDSAFSYQLLAILNAGSVIGRWVPGYVADRIGRFNTMIFTVLLCIISVFGLWLTARAGNPNIPQLCVFAVFFGFASGSNISLTPVCVGQLCETEVLGRWYATCYTLVSLGCLTGIPIAGQILAIDQGKYWGLIIFTGCCYVVGLASFIAARVRKVGWSLTVIY